MVNANPRVACAQHATDHNPREKHPANNGPLLQRGQSHFRTRKSGQSPYAASDTARYADAASMWGLQCWKNLFADLYFSRSA